MIGEPLNDELKDVFKISVAQRDSDILNVVWHSNINLGHTQKSKVAILATEKSEPLSDDEGVDTSEAIEEDQDQDRDDVVPMLEIDPAPCDEDYDNYDSERILQIDESIEEEPTEESGK